MRGVAAGSLIAYTISISVMGWYLFSGRARVVPNLKGLRIRWSMFFDILRVGAIACFSPLQGVLTISIFTHMLANFGTAVLAGYGIGARLEFMLTSVAFAVGIASVPMIGMAVGAGRIARARQIAWTAGTVSFVSVGAIGTFIAFFPDLWVNIFTNDAAVRAASHQYLSTAAPMYAFIGLAISMYFSSQGAAKVVGPVLAQTARLLFIAAGGWWLSTHEATAQSFFALAAASMVVLGVLSCASVVLTRWGSRRGPVPMARPVLSRESIPRRCEPHRTTDVQCASETGFEIPESGCWRTIPGMTEAVVSAAGAACRSRRRHWPSASVAGSCSSIRRHRRRRSCP